MEVKAGYKQTEVGVIPVEWEVPTLGERFSFKNGLNKAKKYFGYGTPIVNYMDVYEHPGIFASDIKGRVSVSKQEHKTFEVRQGDVFFTRTSETVDEIGITAVMLDELEDTVFSGFVLRARPKDDSVEDQFKKYCFASSIVRKQITSKSTYTTRALTNGRVLSAVSIGCPQKSEQRTIARALSDVDALIGALDSALAKKCDLKQAAMQQLLTGQKRLPGFHGEWKVKRLGELFEITSSKRIFQSEWKTEGIPFYRARELAVLSERGCVNNELFICKALYEAHRNYGEGGTHFGFCLFVRTDLNQVLADRISASSNCLRLGDLLFSLTRPERMTCRSISVYFGHVISVSFQLSPFHELLQPLLS